MRKAMLAVYDCGTDRSKYIKPVTFHRWGDKVTMGNTEEMYARTVAIVEHEDGRVETVDPEDIKFIEEP